MFNIKNLLINLLDLTVPVFASRLRVYKNRLNKEYNCYEKLAEISINSKNIVDIGARVGFFTYILREIRKDTNTNYHLFEPLPLNIIILQKLFKRNNNIFIHPYAVGDRDGSIYLERENKPMILTNNALTKTNLNKKGIKRNIVTLETFKNIIKIKSNDLIKIDIEGNESHVIEGGA